MKAFESGLITDFEVDINDNNEYRNEVISKPLRDFLVRNPDWNIYILSSTQNEQIPEKSYLFLYNRKEDLVTGGIPDYKTGEIDTNININLDLTESLSYVITMFEPYHIHWIVDCSW